MTLTNTGINHNLATFMKGVPVEVWLNPTISTDGTVKLTAGLLDVADHANAVNIGYTQDGVELTRNPTFEDIPVDQAINPINPGITQQDVHMKFSMLQVRDYDNFVALQPGTSKFTATGAKGISDSNNLAITMYGICAVAPCHNDTAKYQVMIIYSGYNVANLAAKFSRQWNKTPVDFKAEFAGRTDGKTWLFYETTT